MKTTDEIMEAARNFPANTCPASRHAQWLAESMLSSKKPRWSIDEPNHCGESIATVVTALYQARDRIAELEDAAKWAHHTPALLSDADAAADLAGVARLGAKPPLLGRWHHGNGVLVSGTIRIARWDCDTSPPEEFRDKVLNWLCDTLNAALSKPPQARQPLTVAEVEAIIAKHDYVIHGDRARYIVRMTEQAHGIGAAQKGKP